MVIDQILETWFINNRINLKLIDSVNREGLECTLSKKGGRNAGEQLAHLHWNRLYRLKQDAPEFMKGQSFIEKDEKITKQLLKKRLKESADAYAEWIKKQYGEKGGKAEGFKHGLVSMLGYFINHEAHHRGNILLTLKECGHPVSKENKYEMYNWNKI